MFAGEHVRRLRVVGRDLAADLLVDAREEVVAQVDVVLQEVLQRGGVRGVVDVDDVLHRHPHAERLGRPPAGAPVPLQRLRRAGAGAVLERARADQLVGSSALPVVISRGAVARPDVPRDDRDRVHVVVPVLVVRRALEVEAHDVALRRDAWRPVFHIVACSEPSSLPGLERELHVRGGEGLAVVPGHAPAERDDVALALPAAVRGEPRDELVLERVVAEKRLVEQPEDAGRVAGPERVEAVERPPRGARGVQRRRPRERASMLLCGCRACAHGERSTARARRRRGPRRGQRVPFFLLDCHVLVPPGACCARSVRLPGSVCAATGPAGLVLIGRAGRTSASLPSSAREAASARVRLARVASAAGSVEANAAAPSGSSDERPAWPARRSGAVTGVERDRRRGALTRTAVSRVVAAKHPASTRGSSTRTRRSTPARVGERRVDAARCSRGSPTGSGPPCARGGTCKGRSGPRRSRWRRSAGLPWPSTARTSAPIELDGQVARSPRRRRRPELQSLAGRRSRRGTHELERDTSSTIGSTRPYRRSCATPKNSAQPREPRAALVRRASGEVREVHPGAVLDELAQTVEPGRGQQLRARGEVAAARRSASPSRSRSSETGRSASRAATYA